MGKICFKATALLMTVSILLATILIPMSSMAAQSLIIDEIVIGEKIDEAVNNIVGFNNDTTDEEILAAINTELGDNYTVTKYTDFVKEAAVNGARVQIGAEEYYTRTADGKISGCVLVKTDVDQYLFSFEREIPAKVDTTSYIFNESDVVPDSNYTVETKIPYPEKIDMQVVTGVDVEGYSVMVIDGKKLGAKVIDDTAFYDTTERFVAGSGESTIAGIKVVVIKNIAYNFNTFAEAPDLEVAIFDSGISVRGNVYTVSRIFYQCKKLKYVNLYEGIRFIGHYDFTETENLVGIVVPDSIENIGYRSFMNSGIKAINLPDVAKKSLLFGSSSSGVSDIFKNADNLISIKIPDGVTTLPDGIFSGAESLQSVIFPSTITTVESLAFENCKELEFVQLPFNTNTVANSAFKGTSSKLKYIVFTTTESSSFSPNGLTSATRIAAWNNTPIKNKVGRRFVDIATIYSTLSNGKITSKYDKNTGEITLKVAMNIGAKLPRSGILFSYINKDGVRVTPNPEISENKLEYTYDFTDTIVSDIILDLDQVYTNEEVLAMQREVQKMLDAAVNDGTIGADTEKSDILNLINNQINDIRVNAAFVEELDKQTPVDAVEIYLDGNKIGAAEGRSGYINGVVGIRASGITGIVKFSKELAADNIKKDYTTQDKTVGKLVVIPNNVTEIKTDTYKNDTVVETLIIGSNVMNVEAGAFSGCTALETVIFGADTATLNASMFENAVNLKYVGLSDTITVFEENIFKGAESLKSIVLPTSLKKFNTGYNQFVNSGVYDVIIPAATDKKTVKSNVFNQGTRIYYDGEIKSQSFLDAMNTITNLMDNYPVELNTKEKLESKLDSLVTNSKFTVKVDSFKFRVNRVITTVSLTIVVDGIPYSYVVAVDKTFGDAELQAIMDYSYTELNEATITNETTAEDILNIVKNSIDEDDITYSWVQPFDKTRTIDGAKVLLDGKTVGEVPAYDGRITGVIAAERNGKTATVLIDKVIKANVEIYSYTAAQKAPDSCFEVNKNGLLTNYTGDERYPLVIVPETIKSLNHKSGLAGETATAQTIILPDTVTALNWNTFYKSKVLEVAILSDNVTKLEGYNFLECSNLKYVKMSDNLTRIGIRAFEHCESLVSIKLPSNLKYIDARVFGRTGLKEITIPENVEFIFKEAFDGNTSLTAEAVPAASLEKITVLSRNVRFLDTYMLRGSNGTSADVETPPQKEVEHKDAAQLPIKYYNKNIVVASYKNSTTDKLVKANDTAVTGNTYTSVYLEQSFLEAVNAAQKVMDDIPSDTETADYLLEFVSNVVTNKDVAVKVTDFYYDGINIRGAVALNLKIDGKEYTSTVKGTKKLRVYGYDSMIKAIKDLFASYEFTDETTAEEIVTAVAYAIDSGSAKISWSVPYVLRESVGGAFIKAPGVYKEIKGVDGLVAAYLHIEYRGKSNDIKLERSIPCNMETLTYQTVSKDDEFQIVNRSIYKYNGTAEVIVFPEDADTVQPSAFESQAGIKAVVINDRMKKLAYHCFRKMPDLEVVYIPESCSVLTEQEGIKADKSQGAIFDTCGNLKYVRLSRYTTVIPYFMFARCTSLKEFYIHEGIERICQRSFWQSCGNWNTKAITLPSSLSYIHTWAFAGESGTSGNVKFEEIHILSDSVTYENSNPEYPTARAFANFLNKPTDVYYPSGTDVSYVENPSTTSITTIAQKQSVSQAAVDLKRLFDDFASTEESKVEDLNEKIEKLITNDDLVYKWTTPFKMTEVEQYTEGKLTGAVTIYDKNAPQLSFTIKLNNTIPLFQWVDDRVITIYDSDMLQKGQITIKDANDIKDVAKTQDSDVTVLEYVLYTGIAVLLIAIIAITVIIIVKKKKSKA